MLASYAATMRQTQRNVRLLFTISAILGFTVDGGIYAVIFNLYVLRLNFGPEFVGRVNSAANLVFAFGCLAAGWLGTKWGQRRTMITGLVLVSLGTLSLPLTDRTATAWHGPWVMSTYVVTYSGLALYYVNSGPFLLRAIDASMRGNIFGMQSALNASASFLGGIVGGLLPAIFAVLLGVSLAQPQPYGVPLLLVGLMLVAAVFVLLQTRSPEERPLEARLAAGGGAPTLTAAYGLIIFMAIVRFFQVAGIGSASTFFNVYMDNGLGVATVTIGILTAAARLAAVPAALMGPALSARFGFGATAIFASFCAFLGMLPLALVPSPLVGGAGYITLMAFTSMRYPTFYVYMMERTPERLRSVMNGGNEMAAGLSFSLMSFIGGYVIVTFGYTATFLGGALLTLAGTVIFAVYVRRKGETVVYEG